MNHDARMRQRIALALFACGQKERTHRRGHAETDRIHLRANETHRIKDRHAGRNRAARAVDVKRNILVRIFAFKKEQLSDDQRGRLIVYFRREENNAVTQQTRVMSKLRSDRPELSTTIGTNDITNNQICEPYGVCPAQPARING